MKITDRKASLCYPSLGLTGAEEGLNISSFLSKSLENVPPRLPHVGCTCRLWCESALSRRMIDPAARHICSVTIFVVTHLGRRDLSDSRQPPKEIGISIPGSWTTHNRCIGTCIFFKRLQQEFFSIPGAAEKVCLHLSLATGLLLLLSAAIGV